MNADDSDELPLGACAEAGGAEAKRMLAESDRGSALRRMKVALVKDALKKAYPYSSADANVPMYDTDFDRMANAAVDAYECVAS